MFGMPQRSQRIPIEVEKLRLVCDPFDSLVWHRDLHRPLRKQEIREAVENDCLQEPDRDLFGQLRQCSRRLHIERIAWLVVNGWNRAIEIHVGDNEPLTWVVRDGNHRLAAAIIREDKYIEAYVEGSMGRLQELFIIADDKAPK